MTLFFFGNEQIFSHTFASILKNSLVPGGFASNRKLATWVDLQRTSYRYFNEGKPSVLNEERIKLLEDIGFIWNVYEAKWNIKFEELSYFYEINGHCRVPSKKSTRSLSRWCGRQRQEYRKYLEGKQTTLTDDRRFKLIKIGLLE